jgi:MinD superfamily P-loop ATPase
MPPPRISTEAMADSHMYLASDECALIVLMGIIFSISSEDWQMAGIVCHDCLVCLFFIPLFIIWGFLSSLQ